MHRALRDDAWEIDPNRIFAAIFLETNISQDQITGPYRERPIYYARCLAVYIMRRDAGMTFAAIGRIMNRDHTSIIHADRRAEGRIQTVVSFAFLVQKIREAISQ